MGPKHKPQGKGKLPELEENVTSSYLFHLIQKMWHNQVHYGFGFPCDLAVSASCFVDFMENPNAVNPRHKPEMS